MNQNDVKPIELHPTAEEKNRNGAVFELGWAYEKEKDYTNAIHCYRKAAELGEVRAMLRLGTLYNNGLGTSKNSKKATEWYRKAAETVAVQSESSAELELTHRDIQGQSEPYWQWFSDKRRVFEPLQADPREAKVSISYLKNKRGDSFLDMGFGGDASLLYQQISSDSEMSLTVRGLMTSRFEFFSESFNMINSDFIGGAAFGHRKKHESTEIFVYHQSSHLGDETLERGERTRIDYSREVLRFLYSRNNRNGLRFYGGPSINIRSDPKDIQGRLTLQMGIERQFKLHNFPMYTALDLQSKQENGWDINLTAQVGLYLNSEEDVSYRQRLFIELFNGFSNMGQYYNERELFVRLGTQFNF